MQHRLDFVKPDVSEERVAFILRTEIIRERGRASAVSQLVPEDGVNKLLRNVDFHKI
jgi:hypothetical protein